MTDHYRPEIDGLRALAVAAVLVYHAEVTLWGGTILTGGFLGVDVFFVISGYLICRILLRDLRAGEFSFLKFYERRTRRILPVLLVVLLASFPLAWLSLAPKASLEYAGSLLSSLAFGSNLWFWAEDSYAAEASLLKPLLHTWSLSVEEQFYLFAPAMLLILWRRSRRHLPTFLAAGFIGSLVLAEILSRRNPEAAFFLLPTRAWELLAGALLASLEQKRTQVYASLTGRLAVLCLAIMVAAMFVFNDTMPHPSLFTLAPVAATAVLLALVKPYHFAGRLLSARPMRYLGGISYSLYLWHMPLFAFARNLNWLDGNPPKLVLIGLSWALAHITNRLIENPMRWSVRRSTFWTFIGITTAILLAGGIFTLATDGLAGRPAIASQQILPELDPSDVEFSDARAIVLNVGDSHSSALSGALHEAAVANNFSLRSISSSGTLPIEGLFFLANNKYDERYGADAVKLVSDLVEDQIATETAAGREVFVALSGRLPLYMSNELPTHPVTGQAEQGTPHAFTADGKTVANYDLVVKALTSTIERWRALGAKVILIYPVPEMIYDVQAEFFRLDLQKSKGTWENDMPSVPLANVQRRSSAAYAALDAAGDDGIIRVYPQRLVCGLTDCESVRDGQLLYRDDDHLSPYGARQVVREILIAIRQRLRQEL